MCNRTIILTLVAIAFLVTSAADAQYKISKSVFGNGGMKIATTTHGLVSTLGQPLIGKTSNPTNTILSGFWYDTEIKDYVVDINNPIISNFVLMQNYPNPFNPITSISYDIPHEAKVRIEIFNILGEKVFTLVDENKRAGHHTAIWGGKNNIGQAVPSGVYFYRIQAEGFAETKKMLLLE